MHLDSLLRYATPEALTVLGVLVGGFGAWKVTAWAARKAFGVLKTFTGWGTLAAALVVGGTGSIGAGAGELERHRTHLWSAAGPGIQAPSHYNDARGTWGGGMIGAGVGTVVAGVFTFIQKCSH